MNISNFQLSGCTFLLLKVDNDKFSNDYDQLILLEPAQQVTHNFHHMKESDPVPKKCVFLSNEMQI